MSEAVETVDTSQEEVSPAESVRDTLANTLAEIESRDPDNASESAEPEPEPESDTDDQAEEEAESDNESDAEEPETPDDDTEEDEDTSQEVPISVPKAMRDTFLAMPDEVQELYRKRDKDAEEGITKYAESAKYGDELRKAIEPFRQSIQAAGSNDVQAVQGFLSLDAQLRNGTDAQKQAVFKNLAKYYGVTVGSSEGSSQDESEDEFTDPEIKALKQKIAQLEQTQGESLRSVQEQQVNDAQAQIESFQNAKDDKGNLVHPHFEKVRAGMSKLINAGMADGLDSAYKQAVKLDPEIEAETAKQRQAKAKDSKIKSAKEAKRKQSKSTTRATYTNGASSTTKDNSKASLRKTLESKMREIESRAD
jgi:hypothetical protein